MRKLMIKNTIKWNKQIYYAAIDMLPNSSDNNNNWLVLWASLKTHSSSAMSFFLHTLSENSRRVLLPLMMEHCLFSSGFAICLLLLLPLCNKFLP